MEFKQTTIAPAGRNKYGNYLSSGNVTKSVTTTVYAGNDTTTTIGNTGTTEEESVKDFYCVLSQTNATFLSVDLPIGASAATQVIAYRGYEKAVTYICEIDACSATVQDQAITSLIAPDHMGIRNMPASGLSVSFSGNGTSATTIIFTADNDLTGNSGTLYIPVCVYKRSDNIPEPDDLYSWWEHQYGITSADTIEYIGDCEVVWLEFVWNVNRNAATSYIMDLSNQMAGVNVSAETGSGDILYPNSIATLQCTASTHLNAELVSGITYSIYTQPRYNARGVSIVNSANTGVLKFTSAGTNSFNFLGPSLPIDVIATLNGENIATKTMTINKNYPGSDGTPAHTRYIVTNYDAVKFNPNTSAFTPNQVEGKVMLQIGNQEPEEDLATTIYQWYNDLETGKTSAVGSITASTYLGLESITFALKNSNDVYYEIEEVPVLSEGMNGVSGAPGTSGASGESAWYLTLDNDNASINCDSAGNILSGAVRPSCHARLYYGSTQKQNAKYSVDWGTASGITSALSVTGVLTLTFGSDFDFTGDTLSIYISGKTGTSTTVRDVKVMNITKSYAGTNGEASVSYWIQSSFGEVIYNPNTQQPNPTSFTVNAYMQVGQGAVAPLEGAALVYRWGRRDTGSFENPTTAYTSAMSPIVIGIDSGKCETYNRLRLTLYLTAASQFQWVQVDQEDIDILKDGEDGQDGQQGRSGAAIRGPYNYADVSASTRCWCAGESGNSCSECSKWIDVVKSGDTYYYCNTTYYGTLASHFPGYWTSGDSFDFVATKLLLAENASIDFLTNNEIYLKDENGDITGGARGGSGITFWAGGDLEGNTDDLPFRVMTDGTMYAKNGVFGGYIQMPYTDASELEHSGGTQYNPTVTYFLDTRAYVIVGPSGVGTPSQVVLPTPNASLNGFVYYLIVKPARLNMQSDTEGLSVNAIVSGMTDAILDYVYQPYGGRGFEKAGMFSGKYQFVCVDISGTYKWLLTEATGGAQMYGTTHSTLESDYRNFRPVFGFQHASGKPQIKNISTETGYTDDNTLYVEP